MGNYGVSQMGQKGAKSMPIKAGSEKEEDVSQGSMSQ